MYNAKSKNLGGSSGCPPPYETLVLIFMFQCYMCIICFNVTCIRKQEGNMLSTMYVESANLCLSVVKGAVLMPSLESQTFVKLHHLPHSLTPHTPHILITTTLCTHNPCTPPSYHLVQAHRKQKNISLYLHMYMYVHMNIHTCIYSNVSFLATREYVKKV